LPEESLGVAAAAVHAHAAHARAECAPHPAGASTGI